MRTYYDVLSVMPGAPPEVIRAAYRALAQTWHPDRNKAPDAAENMRSINAAYGVLSDPGTRSAYDQWLESGAADGFSAAPHVASAPFDVDEEKLAQAIADVERRQRRTAAEWIAYCFLPVHFYLYRRLTSSRDQRRA